MPHFSPYICYFLTDYQTSKVAEDCYNGTLLIAIPYHQAIHQTTIAEQYGLFPKLFHSFPMTFQEETVLQGDALEIQRNTL
jgi:hypothetical protein